MCLLFQAVSSDFCDYLNRIVDDDGVTPENFLDDLYKYGLESIALIALDCRMGCFKVKCNNLHN